MSTGSSPGQTSNVQYSLLLQCSAAGRWLLQVPLPVTPAAQEASNGHNHQELTVPDLPPCLEAVCGPLDQVSWLTHAQGPICSISYSTAGLEHHGLLQSLFVLYHAPPQQAGQP